MDIYRYLSKWHSLICWVWCLTVTYKLLAKITIYFLSMAYSILLEYSFDSFIKDKKLATYFNYKAAYFKT